MPYGLPSASNPNLVITYSPADYVGEYHNISVGDETISINKYMIGDHSVDEGGRKRSAVLSAAQKQNKYVIKNAFRRANYGKVSAEDCQHILDLAVSTGTVKPADLQKWADACLGVDCTGFAVAYFSAIGRIDIDKYVGGAGCHFLVDRAIKGAAAGTAVMVWDLDDVSVGDMVIWMTEKRVETRRPGHIALVSYVMPNQLVIAESSGAPDLSGHRGPKNNTKLWNGIKKENGTRYISIGKQDQVIIVRPPAAFG
ncbi:MAG: hypothetical protein ACRCXM_03575 [Beijerinckiaceae bacterium]